MADLVTVPIVVRLEMLSNLLALNLQLVLVLLPFFAQLLFLLHMLDLLVRHALVVRLERLTALSTLLPDVSLVGNAALHARLERSADLVPCLHAQHTRILNFAEA